MYSKPGNFIPTNQLIIKLPRLVANATQTRDPGIFFKKSISTFEDSDHSIGVNAIQGIIALTTWRPRLSTIFANLIVSSCSLWAEPSTLTLPDVQIGM